MKIVVDNIRENGFLKYIENTFYVCARSNDGKAQLSYSLKEARNICDKNDFDIIYYKGIRIYQKGKQLLTIIDNNLCHIMPFNLTAKIDRDKVISIMKDIKGEIFLDGEFIGEKYSEKEGDLNFANSFVLKTFKLHKCTWNFRENNYIIDKEISNITAYDLDDLKNKLSSENLDYFIMNNIIYKTK